MRNSILLLLLLSDEKFREFIWREIFHEISWVQAVQFTVTKSVKQLRV